jgi:hypothetical protein
VSRIAVALSWTFAAVALAGAVAGPDWLIDQIWREQAEQRASAIAPTSQPAQALLPTQAEPAAAEILGRSPFDRERRAFSRDLPPPPPPPPVPPRLLGISTQNGKRVAILEWPSTGQTQRVVEGDTTELGKVTALESARVILRAGDVETVVSLFP